MIKFQGSRKEFGILHAKHLQDYHHDFYSHTNANTLHKQFKIYQKYYPEIIEEIYAVAEALGQKPEFMLYEDIASFVDSQRRNVNRREHGCTIFAIAENGKVFVGRNYDWLPEAREFFESYDLAFTGANRYFAFSDEGVYGRHTERNTRALYAEDAVNEYGLYIGITYAHINKWNYGLSPSHFVRYIAEHCRTTRQALNAFARIPCAVPKNFLIADATGQIAVVEHAAKFHEIVRPKKVDLDADHHYELLVKTNNALSPKTLPLDRVYQKNHTATTYVRQAEANYLIEEQLPGFQFTDLWRILRQSRYVYNNETIWSLALELSSQRFNIYFDTAMGMKHTKFGF